MVPNPNALDRYITGNYGEDQFSEKAWTLDAPEIVDIVLKDQVIPYKEHIRKLVDANTIWEINRWYDWYGLSLVHEILREDRENDVPQPNRWLRWVVLVVGVGALYYFLSGLFI